MAANTTLSGKIGTLKGTVKVIDSQGQEHILKVGDVIHPNDHLIFEQGASLLLNQDGGQQVELSDTKETGAPAAGNAAPQTTTPSDASNPAVPGWNVTTNGQPPQPGQDGNTANANTEAQSVLASLANGQDPLAQLESAAAGLTDSGGASANIDHTFIDLTGNTNTAGTLGTGFTPSVGPNATHSTFTSISTAPLNASFTPAPAPPVTLTFNNVGLTNHSEPILQGTGSPGLTVTVSEANGTVLGNTVVGADGSWSLTPSQPLSQGASTLIATSSNNAGQSTQSTATVTVDTISPLTPAIHISQHADGTGSAAISQTDLVNGAVRATVQLDANDLQQQGLASITLTEGGQPTTLTVHSDGSITGLTAGIQASYANGLVTLTIQPARSGTLLQIAASQTDAAGNVSSSASDQGIVSTAPPPAPQITIVDHAGTIASGDIHNQQVSVQIALNNPLLQAGTTLTLASNTGAAYNHVLTTADLQNGSLALNIPAAANGQNLTLNAQFTDSIGNPSATSTLTATVNTTPPATPSVAITEHSGQQIASGDVANGQVLATVSLDAGNLANGGSAQVSISDGGASSSVTVHSDGSVSSSNPAVTASYANGVLSLGIPEPANGQAVSVSATQSNALGNVSSTGSASGTLNLTPPDAPTVAIVEHSGQQIGSSDLAGGHVQATVNLSAANLSAGGSALVTISDGSANSSVTVHSNGTVTSSSAAVSGHYANGVLSLGIPEPANGQAVSVSATQTNALGNVSNPGSAGGTLNLTAPAVPTVSITEHAGQQIASGDVANGQVQATVSLDAGNLANGGSAQVSISDGGASSTVTVHSDGSVTSSNPAVTASYAGGVLSLGIPEPANGQVVSVSATQTNVLGNTSAAGTTGGTLNLTAPAAPTVSITEHAGQQIASGDVANGQVQATVSLDAGNLANGGSAQVSISDGGASSTVSVHSDGSVTSSNPAVTASYAGGVLSLGIPEPANGQAVSVSATQTNALGNTSAAGTTGGTLNLTAPAAPTVSITEHAGQQIASGDVANGQVQATVSLDAGNLANGGSAQVSISDGGASSTVTVHSNGSVTSSSSTVSGHYANGVLTLSLPEPANGQQVSVSATQTNALGNVSNAGSAGGTLNLTPPDAPTVSIVEHSGQQIGSSDLSGNHVQATVNLSASNLASGGSALVTIHDGSANSTVTVHSNGSVTSSSATVSGHYANGVLTLSLPEPANGQQVSVSATQTNALGNVSAAGSASGTLNLTPPDAPTVSIVEHSGKLISSPDLAGGHVQATVNLSDSNLSSGGIALITIKDGNANSTVTVHSDGSVTSSNPAVTASYAGGVLSLGIPEPANGQQVSVSATQTNVLGNVSAAGSASGTLNLTAPAAPTVSITEHAGQQIGSSDLSGNHVQAKVNLNASNLANGGSAQISINDGGASSTVTVHSDGSVTSSNPAVSASYAKGVLTLGIPEPANGQQVSVSATQTNALGNVSNAGSAGGTLNLTPPDAPTVSIVEHSGQQIGSSDLSGNHVQATVNLSASNLASGGSALVTIHDGSANSTVTVHSNGIVTSSSATVSGHYANGVLTLSLPEPANGQQVSVSATQTNVLGNVSAAGSASGTLNLTPPDAPTVSIVEHSGKLISSPDLAGGHVQATVNLSDSNLSSGGSALITIKDGSANSTVSVHSDGSVTSSNPAVTASYAGGVLSLGIPEPANGQQVSVSATQTNVLGNVSAAGSASGTLNLTAPAAPTVSITEHAGQQIGSSDLSGNHVQAKVNLSASNLANGGSAQVSISDGGASSTVTVHSDGSVTSSNPAVTASYAKGVLTLGIPEPANGQQVSVSATQTNALGNVSNAGSAGGTLNLTPPDAPTVSIVEHSGQQIGSSDLSGNHVQATVNLSASNLASGGSALVTIHDGSANSTVTVHSNGSVTSSSSTVSGHYANGVLTLSLPEPANGQQVSVSATQTNVLGNVSAAGSASGTLNLTPPDAPTVSIVEHSGKLISSPDLAGGHVQATVNLSDSNLSSGGSALITIKDGSANSTVSVHSDGSVTSSNPAVSASYAGGVLSLGIPEPANGQTVSVSATQTNVLGNVSAAGSDSGTLDVVPPDAPAISFQPNGLTALLYGLNDSHISSPASGQTALSTVLADLTNHSPTASFVATSLNFGDQNGVWHGSTDFGNNLGNSLANLNAFLGGNASNLQLASAYGVTTQSILTLNGAFSAAAGNYTLNVNADDGFQIIVDGKVVSQFTGNEAQTEHDVALTLGATAGNLHAIQIVYWDQGGNAVLQVGLTPAGAPAGATPTPLTLSSNTLVGSVTLDSNDQQALSNHGSLTVTEGASQLQLSLNANGQLVDGGGTVYAYQNGVVYLPLSGNAATLAATVTDSVGNVSLNASASYAPPPAPTVTLIEHTAQGDQIGAGDLAGGKVQATVALDPISLANNGFATLTIHDGGASSTVTVNSAGVVSSSSSAVSASYADGTVTLAIAAPANGQAVSISATQTDSLGHASSSGSASGTLNLTPPAAPIVTVAEHFDPNGWIGPTDLAHGQVQATVALDSNSLGNGGSAQVSINDGGVTSSVTVHSDGSVTSSNPAVTASYAGGVLSLGIPEPANGQQVSVSATQTNALGNVSAAASDSGTLDVVPPDAPAISFQPNGLTALLYGLNDSHISNPASGQTALSTVLADLTNYSPTASFIATSLNFGDQNGVWHGSTDFGNNLGNSLANLNAFLGGNASNLQLASSYGVTTQSILTLNGAFSAAAGNYTLNVNADDGFQIIVDGKVVSQFTGNEAQTEHDVALTLGATAGNLHAIQIVFWDQGGNAVLQVGLTPAGAPAGATPTPLTLSSNTLVGSVTLDSNDQQALSNHGSLTVTEGASQISLSLNANGQLVDGGGTVYAYQNGVVYLPLSGNAATLAATVTDSVGNVSLNASASYAPPPAPTVTLIEHTAQGDQIGAGDLAGGKVQATVALDPISLANNGFATLTIHDGGASSTVTVNSAGVVSSSSSAVSASYADGTVTLAIAAPANGQAVSISATQTDSLGHASSSGNASGTLNLTPPAAPIVTVAEHFDPNGWIGPTDLAHGQVQATVALDSNSLGNGGSAQVSINDGGVTSSVTVHSDGSVTSSNPAVTASYAGGVLSLGIPEPANGQTVSVSATQTNVLGNVSAAGSDSGTLDVAPPDAPAISFQPNGLTALLYGLNDSHISSPASGQTALSTVLADLTNHSPTASFVATSLNFGDQNGVWHGSTDFGNNLGNSLANLNAFLGGNASNLQLTSAYGVTTQSILTLNGAFSAAAGNYTLNVNADDGFQIIVDGKVVSQFTGNEAQTEHDVALTLGATAGNLHTIQIVYWDQGGNAVLQVGLTPAGAPAGATPTPLTLSSNTLVGSVTLDSNDQQALANHGSLTVTEGASQLQLSLNANGQLVDGGGTVYAYQNGVVYLPLGSASEAATVAATVTDGAGNVSLNASGSYTPLGMPQITLGEPGNNHQEQASVGLDANSLANHGYASIVVSEAGASTTLAVHSDGSITGSTASVTAAYAQGNVNLSIATPANAPDVTVTATATDGYGHSNTVSQMQVFAAHGSPVTAIAGVETFKFEASFNGHAGTPSVETIQQFNTGTTPSGAPADVLDLRDLLVGDSHNGADPSSIGNLANYLHFSTVNNNGTVSTVIHVNENGAINANSPTSDTAQIVLQGVDLTHSGSTLLSDQAIIQKLLGSGQLHTD